MENLFLSALIEEIRPIIRERLLSRVFINGYDLFIDLRLPDDRVLKISVDPVSPCLYLSSKEVIQTGDSKTGSYFQSLLRKNVVGSRLIDIRKDPLDRKVRIAFEGYDSAGNRRCHSMFVALTGRSSNVYLTDDAGRIDSMWLQRGGLETGDQLELDDKKFDTVPLLAILEESPGKEEIIERFFASNSIFGPPIQKEFLARSAHQSAVEAFRSLIEDLFYRKPVPILYSRVPVDEVGSRPLQIKDDLLLSHFELAMADGLRRNEFPSLSEAAEAYYELRARAIEFQKELAAVSQYLKTEIKKRENLMKALAADRARHEDPERLKQYGDLLLANLSTARLNDGKVIMVDYYDPRLSEIEIEIGEGQSLQQAAAAFFARYQKARRALTAIEARESELRAGLEPLREMLIEIEEDTSLDRIRHIGSRLDQTYKKKRVITASRRQGKQAGGRWFLSTDGFEIVVGRNDRDNDFITFRLARPQDIWMHAADYPGSHVIIRNPQRIEVPYRTIVEAAELAAFYSSAKELGKAAVHYTQRKYVTKPPRSKPGLVRLSSLKTVMVEPRAGLERIT